MAFEFSKKNEGQEAQARPYDDRKRNHRATILCSCEGCSQPADVEIGGKDLCNFHFACKDFPDLMTRELDANADLVKLAKSYDATRNEVLREMIFSEFRGRIAERGLNRYRYLTAEGSTDWVEAPLPIPKNPRKPWAFVRPIDYLQALLCDRIDAAVAISRAKKGSTPALSQEEKARRQFDQLLSQLGRMKPKAPLYASEPPFPDEIPV